MDQATYQRLAQSLEVREVRVRVYQRGFRVRSLVVVTTLLDANVYSREEIAEAFRQRWHAELDLRAIKQTMGMSVILKEVPFVPDTVVSGWGADLFFDGDSHPTVTLSCQGRGPVNMLGAKWALASGGGLHILAGD